MNKKLNNEQLEAVTQTEGFVRVIAGAGSGKTRALTHRFAFLVNEAGILPSNILCVTFTNKAASEMRRRIHKLTGDNDTGYISTFHGFCVGVLQEDSYAVSYPRSFFVIDNGDIDEMLKIIYEERDLTLRDMTFRDARDMIEMQKLRDRPDYYLDMITMPLDTLRDKYINAANINDIIFFGYLYQEKKCFALDYNDLLTFTLYIFDKNPDIRLKWQQRLEYIMIDEFQDIDRIQYRLMQILCGFHKNLYIVGDPDQTIYSWRGADTRFLMEFDREFPNVRTIMMTKNYRSTPQIIAAVNSLIDKNEYRIPKSLIPTLPDGKSVVCLHASDPADEAAHIAGEIENLHENGAAYRDITILYRAHYLTRTLEQALRGKKIPYNIYSGVNFFDRAEIKDALSYLRFIVYRDDLSFRRIINIPKRNIGRTRLDLLTQYAGAKGISLYSALCENAETENFKKTKAAEFIDLAESMSKDIESLTVSELLAAVIDKSGYEELLRTEGSQERLDNLAELKQSVFEFETESGEECTPEKYLTHAALFTNSDQNDRSDRVRLMTVHAAKGLEFPYVFLCAMNEGIFPSKRTDSQLAMEEERRLAFVAMTRAEKRLYLSEAESHGSESAPKYPSRFLFDISPDLLEFVNKPDEGLIEEAKEYIKNAADRLPKKAADAQFKVGSRVIHSVFGAGTIVSIDEGKKAYIIKFDSVSTERKISFKAKIEPAR